MAKKKITTPIDSSPYTTVVTCPSCHWRDITTDRAHAWYKLARHLKAAHGDLRAADTARKNGWRQAHSRK